MLCVNRNVISTALMLATFSVGCDDGGGTEDPRECTQEEADSCVTSCNDEGYSSGGVLAEVDCSCVCIGTCTTRAATYSCGYMAIEGDCPSNILDAAFNTPCELTFAGTEECGPWEATIQEYDAETECDVWLVFRGQLLGYSTYDNWLDLSVVCPDLECHHTVQIYIN